MEMLLVFEAGMLTAKPLASYSKSATIMYEALRIAVEFGRGSQQSSQIYSILAEFSRNSSFL